jgi:hypothetical protein
MLPPPPANSLFCLRVNGRVVGPRTNKLFEAEWMARQKFAAGFAVEILDVITGQVISRFPEVRSFT